MKKFLFICMMMLTLCFSLFLTNRVSANTSDLIILENGVWSSEATYTNSSMTEAGWTTNGTWGMDRAVLKSPVDLSGYEKLVVTYTTAECTGGDFGLANVLEYGEVDASKTWVNLTADGSEHTFEISLADYDGKANDKCSWGGNHSDRVLDLSSISAFYFGSGKAVSISKIVAVPVKTVEAQDTVVLDSGVWSSEATYTNSSMTESGWTTNGTWGMDRVVLATPIDLSKHEKLVVTYTTAECTGGDFGLANVLEYGEVDASKTWVNLTADGSEHTFEVSLADYDGKANDKCSWGGNHSDRVLDLSSISAFYFGSGKAVTISKIVATGSRGGQVVEPDPFDPTPVEKVFLSSPAYVSDVVLNSGGAPTVTYGDDSTTNYYTVAAGATDNSAVTIEKTADGNIKVSNCENVRFDYKENINLVEAMLNDGYIKFDLKVEGLTSFDLLTYDGSGQWGERYASVTPMTVSGEGMQTYEVKISDLVKHVTTSNWGSVLDTTLDLKLFRGIAIRLPEAGTVEINNIKYGYTPVDRTLTGIEASSSRTECIPGEKFNLSDLTVNAVFSDGSVVSNIAGFTVTAPLAFSETENSVTVNYRNGKETLTATVTYAITAVSDLEIITMPSKVEYVEGEEIDITGLVVNAVLGTQKIENVVCSIDKQYAMAGDTCYTVTYGGISKEIAITVTPADNSVIIFDESYVMDAEAKQLKDGFYSNGATYGEGNVLIHEQENDWTNSRVLSDHNTIVLDLQRAYMSGETVNIYFTYKTTNLTKITVLLFNPVKTSTWDQAYTKVDVELVADGTWRVAKVNLDDLYKAFDGHMDNQTDCPTTDISLKDITGFGIIGKGKVEISKVEVKWNGTAKGGYVDYKAPSISYTGEYNFTAKEGDAPIEVEVSAKDNVDGDVEVERIWSEGAIVDGKLTAGTHTLILRATDKSGNKTNDADYTLTVVVEKVAKPEPTPDPEPTPTPDPEPTPTPDPKPAEKKGCFGRLYSSLAIISLCAVAIITLRRKLK